MIPIVRVAFSSAVAVHGHLSTRRTLPWQPLASLPIGLAFQAGTWDNNDHSWREGAPGRIAAKHTLPGSRLRSYVPESKLEEKQLLPS